MVNFLSDIEQGISKDFEKNGYIIKKIIDIKSLNKIRAIFIKSIKKI